MIRALSCLSVILLLSGCEPPPTPPPPPAPTPTQTPSPTPTPTPSPEPLPDRVRVRLDTGEGPILLELDARRAPITAANFVRYVEAGRFDNTSFYRAAPSKSEPDRGFIQGGIKRNYRLMYPPIEHEPTSKTGLRHQTGTISMAQNEPGRAMGEFFITTTRLPSMDAREGDAGYAAFGRVVEGMDVVHRILGARRDPRLGRGVMRGQMLAQPVPITKAERID
jgi:peptidyl-prolyl cis-trans isomerase A (cyclophilin A)